MLQLHCILLHTGWNAELNFQVSLFNSINLIASSCICKYRETKHSSKLLNSLTKTTLFYFYFKAILILSHLFFPILSLHISVLFLVYQMKKIGLLFYLCFTFILNLFLSKTERSGVFYLYFPIKSCKTDCFIPIFLWVAKAMACSFAK